MILECVIENGFVVVGKVSIEDAFLRGRRLYPESDLRFNPRCEGCSLKGRECCSGPDFCVHALQGQQDHSF